MRRSNAWMLGSILLVFLMVLGVSCAKKVETQEVKPTVAPAPTPAPAPEVTPPPAPAPGVSKAEEAKKAIEASDIYFDFDKYNLKPEAIKVLDTKVALMRENSMMNVRIEGNCDERGSNEYNLALGDRRANAAKSYMVKAGIAADRLSTISYGEERPVCREHTEPCWAKNRHDHLEVQ
jgi:peptidoglycan-associated lipoprotein